MFGEKLSFLGLKFVQKKRVEQIWNGEFLRTFSLRWGHYFPDVYTHQTILKAHLLKIWNRSHLLINFSLTTKNGWNNVTLFCRVFFSQNNKNCWSFFLLFIVQHVVDLRRTSVGKLKFEVSFPLFLQISSFCLRSNFAFE